MKCGQSGKLIRDSVKRFCIEGWSYSSFSQESIKISDFQNESRCSAWINCMVGTLPKSKFLDTNQGLPCKQAFSCTRVETCDVNCFLHSCGSWLVPLTVLPGTVGSSGSPELQSCDKVPSGPDSSHKGGGSWFSFILLAASEGAGPRGEHHDSQG